MKVVRAGATGYRGLAPAARPRGAARPREGRSMCIGAVWRSRMGGSGGRGAGSGSAGGRCCRCVCVFFCGKLECDGSEQMCQGLGVAALASGKGDDKPCGRFVRGQSIRQPCSAYQGRGLPKVYGTSRVFRNMRGLHTESFRCRGPHSGMADGGGTLTQRIRVRTSASICWCDRQPSRQAPPPRWVATRQSGGDWRSLTTPPRSPRVPLARVTARRPTVEPSTPTQAPTPRSTTALHLAPRRDASAVFAPL